MAFLRANFCIIFLFWMPVPDCLASHPADTTVVFDNVSVVPVSNDVWWFTSNPVGISMIPFVPYGELNFTYSEEKGSYRRPTKPENLNYFNVRTEGYAKTDKLFFYGNMGYRYGKELGLKWNNVSFISENNPFAIADSSGGNYENEIYSLEGVLSSKTTESGMKWGVGARYEVGHKTNQSDPRPLIQSMRSAIVPGVAAMLNNWEIGANLTAEYFKEETDFTVINQFVSHRYFRFKGLGQFQGATDDFFSRNYQGRRLGGSLQTAYRIASFVNLLDLSVSSIYERAQEGATNSRYLAGDYEDLILALNDYIRINRYNKTHELNITVQLSKVDGIWHDQREETAEDGTRYWVTYNSSIKYTREHLTSAVEYALTTMEDDLPGIRVRARAEYQRSRTRYYPELYYEDIDNLRVSVDGQKNWYTGWCNLSLRLASSYRHNLSGDFYSEGELKYFIAQPEYNYPTTNLIAVDTDLKVGFPGLWGGKALPFISLGYEYQSVLNNNENYKNGDKRTIGQIRAGFNF